MKKKIILLALILFVSYCPFGCTSCGLFEKAPQFVVTDFELKVSEFDSTVWDIADLRSIEEKTELSFEKHYFVLLITETKSASINQTTPSTIKNPFIYTALACEFLPYTNQKLSNISITSSAPIHTIEKTYQSGEELNELFQYVYSIYMSKTEIKNESKELDEIHTWGYLEERQYFRNLFRLKENVLQNNINHVFHFKIEIDDGKLFNFTTEQIKINIPSEV